MVEEIVKNLRFDREHWPVQDTQIPITPSSGYDLGQLWNDYPDQASVFVAEALINESHFAHGRFDEPEGPYATVPIWDIGGDVMQVVVPMIELIEDIDDYSPIGIRSEAQAEDVRSRLENLKLLEDAIQLNKQILLDQLKRYGEQVNVSR